MLSDGDLSKIKWHIRLQRVFPLLTAGFLGGFMYTLDTQVFRKSFCLKRIGLLSTVGFLWGAHHSASVGLKMKRKSFSEGAQSNFDSEIMNAF